ncbi:aldo/keto reductase [Cohnella terricola]|uniref:Aldo/keto reductase n=1 Tax=Cohnella terricola TaxID=1289167 RepID=A0A559JTW1_9BACL|nr:aldo/keto reductase [Cohnella terricola]TVY03314.1 aldo/keto reductase [Cohnella terricola]
MQHENDIPSKVRHLSDTVVLNNGVRMPWFGLGVFQANDGEEVKQSVLSAIKAGYRSIDTAAAYENEQGVGEAIRQSGVAREQLFITTKLANPDQGYESALEAFESSLGKLGLDYIDLYLIHWPVEGKYKESWRALEKLYDEGRIRAIGVSNFQIHHLEHLMEGSAIVPTVNQVELHPRLSQRELRQFCARHGIQVEAWSPLMKGQLLDNETIVQLAAKHGKTPSQIILRWDVQSSIITIPKSVKEARIRENSDIFDFELSDDDMKAVDELNLNHRIGPDPDNFDF